MSGKDNKKGRFKIRGNSREINSSFSKISVKLLNFLHKKYKVLIAPFIPYNCRYYPSCSDYLIQALKSKGMFKGMCLFLKRIIKCNQFFPGGYDPVR